MKDTMQEMSPAELEATLGGGPIGDFLKGLGDFLDGLVEIVKTGFEALEAYLRKKGIIS